MTYTLAMAAKGIEIADDGVAEVSMTDARAFLTRLIREVRWGGRPAAFTERGQRVAFVVPPDTYAEDRRRAETVTQMRAALKQDESLANTFRAHYSELYEALTGDGP